jgi:hypothetical protein
MRYYSACQALLQPNSELGLIVSIGLLANSGGLEDLAGSYSRQEAVNVLAERCKQSTACSIAAAAQLMLSLTNENRSASK